MKARSQSSSIPKKRSDSPNAAWTCESALAELRRLGKKRNVEGMARFGIVAKSVYGVPKPEMDELARRIGRNHQLALELWKTGVHDARILAGMIDEPAKVTAAQMDRWVRDFDNWDVCDGTCCHLFVFAGAAWDRARQWTKRTPEFEKRAGFALLAYLAYRDKTAKDARYEMTLPILLREAQDDRNFVRKAVNWALRNIGKRNIRLNRAAVQTAERMKRIDSRAARWIAADALRELKSEAVQNRLRRKKGLMA
jgi:3-methyladenine DNA glycosylase AlkD